MKEQPLPLNCQNNTSENMVNCREEPLRNLLTLLLTFAASTLFTNSLMKNLPLKNWRKMVQQNGLFQKRKVSKKNNNEYNQS